MKTLTMRVDDSIYEMIKLAADGQRRNISNFIEFATMQYLSSSQYVSESEMSDKKLVDTLRDSDFYQTKAYFQECLEDMQSGEAELLSQEEYKKEMHVFMNDLKSKYANH